MTSPKNDRLVKEFKNREGFQGIVVSEPYTAAGKECVDVYDPRERKIWEKVPSEEVVDEGVDPDDRGRISLKGKSLSRIILEMLREYAMRPCLGVKEDTEWIWYSFGDINRKLKTLGYYLGASCPAHAFICVVAENSLNYIVILLACMVLGLTAVPLSMNFKLADYATILAELQTKGPIGAVITSVPEVFAFLTSEAVQQSIPVNVLNIDDARLFIEDSPADTQKGLITANPPCPALHSRSNKTFMSLIDTSPSNGWKCHQCGVVSMELRWACPCCSAAYCLSCKPLHDPEKAYVGVLDNSTLLVRVSHLTGTGRYLHEKTLKACTFEISADNTQATLILGDRVLQGMLTANEIVGENFRLTLVSKGGGRTLESRCPNGHRLLHRIPPPEVQEPGYQVYFKCDLCDTAMQFSEMGCHDCDFDICKQCCESGICPAGHPMLRSSAVERDLVCNECNDCIEGVMYACVICDYDRCLQCKKTRETATFVLYTSGSSGMAKGAVIQEETFLKEVSITGTYSPTGFTSVSILNSPISVSSTPYTLLTVMLRGGRLAVTNASQNGFEIYKEVAPTSLGLVPQIWGILYKAYEAETTSENEEENNEKYRKMLGHRIRSLNCGGARPNRDVMQWLKKIFPSCYVTENYAATETGPITFGKTSQDGWSPLLNGIKYKLYNQTATKPYPKGELCVITPTMFSGYLNTNITTAMFTKDGYYRTGDIVEVDESKKPTEIRVIDRESSIFKLANGEWCSPETIENVLMKSHLIKQCFIHGNSHMDAVVCIAVVGGGVHGDEIDVLSDFQKIAQNHKLRQCEIPQKIHLVSSTEPLPLTDTSKLCRRKIRERYDTVLKKMETSEDPTQTQLLATLSKLICLQTDPTDKESEEWEAVPWSSITAIQTQLLVKDLRKQDIPITLLLGGASLREFLNALKENESGVADKHNTVREEDEVHKWLDGVQKETVDNPPPILNGKCTVLVTGGTGFYGAAIVKALEDDERVKKIFAVSRSAEKGKERVKGKVTWVHGDLKEENLGVADKVVDACDAVVHCAAEVNHVKNYAQLKETNCGGTREVLKISREKRLVFVSSISVLEAGDTSGYTTTKRVSEKMVANSRASSAIVRPGLLAPCALSGACNTQDWCIRAIRSTIVSKKYRINPDCHDLYATPVDYAARYLVALLFGGTSRCVNLPTAKTDLCELYKKFGQAWVELSGKEWGEHLRTLFAHDPIFPFKQSVQKGYSGCPMSEDETLLEGMPPPGPITNVQSVLQNLLRE